MKKLILLILFSATSICLLAQVPVKDSLLTLISKTQEDTTKIMLLLNIQKVYANEDFDSSFYYLNRAKNLAKKLNTIAYDHFINTAFSQHYYHNNDYKKSVEYSLKNKMIAEKTNDLKLLAKTYNNLAAIYNHFGQYRSAIDYALKCLALSEKTKDSTSFAIRNLTASATYYHLEQFEKSILYSRKAIDFGKKFNNSFAVTMGLNNLAASYSELYKIDSAIIFYEKQLDFAKKQKDIVNINYALINLSLNHFKNGNAIPVQRYTTELNAHISQLADANAIAEAHHVNALNFILRKKYSLAKSRLDSGIIVASKENSVDALKNIYQTYAKFYYTQNKIIEAEHYSYKYDSLVRADNLKGLNFYANDLEAKYESQKKNAQIQLQQASIRQKNTLNYILIGGAAALLIIILLGYRNYRHRQKLQTQRITELETEKQLTATEAVLKGEEQERTRLAKDLHDGLGGMLSGIKYSFQHMKGNMIMTPDNAQAFERSMDMLDSSIKEMRRVAHNMMPEALVKFGLDTALKDFCTDINLTGALQVDYQSIGMETANLDDTTAITIFRIVQELLNNTMKHASANTAIVQLAKSDGTITVTVEDDGKGFNLDLLTETHGIGWANIKNRVDFLKGKIDVKTEPDKGISVLIEFKV